MRRIFDVLMIAALAWLALDETAVAREQLIRPGMRMAQFKSDTPIRVVPAKPAEPAIPAQPAVPDQAAAPGQPKLPPESGPPARASTVGQFGFRDPPLRSNDPKMIETLTNVAEILNTSCSRKEAFIWPNVGNQTARAEEVFTRFDSALNTKGYDPAAIELPVPDDKVAAEGLKGIMAYEAVSRNTRAPDRTLLLVWYTEAEDVYLMLCAVEPKKKLED